jgi:hypothetical protein
MRESRYRHGSRNRTERLEIGYRVKLTITMDSAVQGLLRVEVERIEDAMSVVRLLGFTTLACGCVVGRYREVATSREVSYVEEKGKSCGSHGHRRNHTVAAERFAATLPLPLASKAS